MKQFHAGPVVILKHFGGAISPGKQEREWI
jgi:hypothetical protein